MGGAGLFGIALLCAIWVPTASQIVFETEPEDVFAAVGSPALFNCSVTASNPVSITWLKDGAAVVPGSRFSYLANNSLLIDPLEQGDGGEYTCRVTDSITQEAGERSGTLTVAYILPSFIVSPSDTTVNEGNLLQKFCIHGGSIPAADITWTINNDVITTSSRITIVSQPLAGSDPPQTSSSLYVTSVVPSDAGSYQCVASNQYLPGTTVTSAEGIVTVIGVPRPPSITQNPANTVVAPGNTATFMCSAEGQPLPTFVWYNSGVAVSSEQASIDTSGGSSTLTLTGVTSAEEGLYACTASNSEGSATSSSAQLQLASLGTIFQLQPEDTVTTVNTDTRLDCLPPPSVPMATISWTKNYAQLPGERFTVLANGSLHISLTQLGDQALYHCTATNQVLGVSVTSEGADVYVLALPTITPSSVTVSIGQSTTFLCEASGTPPPTLTWYNGTNEITASTPRVTLTPSTLTIHNITREDQGELTCQATYPNGSTETDANLNVNAPPLFVDPTISLTTVQGHPTTLPCHTLPDATLTFNWLFEGNPIQLPSNDEDGPTLLSNGSLFYPSISETVEGTFTCVASNSLGTAQGTVQLAVLVPPSVTPSSLTVTVTEGDTAVLSCTITGDPPPVVTWYRAGTVLPGETGNSLTLVGVAKDEEGTYECAGSNQAGDARATITLVVNTHPSVEATPSTLSLLIGSTATFSCMASGDPTPSITWYSEDGTDVSLLGDPRFQISGGTLTISDITTLDSQRFTCTAANVVGSNSTTVQLNVLAPPSVSLPPTTTGLQGDPLTLDCSVAGNPTPSVSWFKDSQPLTASSRVSISGGVLAISSLFSTDGGSYTCVASNSEGSASANTLLTVLAIPVIHASATSVTVNEGDTAILDCNATGNPTPSVSWLQNSLPVPIPGDSRIQQAANNSLIVAGVTQEDEGDYVCRAENIAGMETATVDLVVNVAPSVTALELAITAIQSSDVTLTCRATGQPTPVLVWYRNGEQIPNNFTPRFSLETEVGVASLVIASVVKEDEGQYVCEGTNVAGSNQQTVTLTVLVPPTISPHPPNSTVTEGTSHTLTCTATGSPLPLITWSRGGVVLSTQGTLTFPSLQRSDSGTYTCTASNTAGSDVADSILNVLYPPSITQPPLSQTIHLSSPVQFECVADGNPAPQISWNFQENPIAGAQGSIFSIDMVTGANVGVYTCIATNSVGEDRADASLTVLFPPSPPTITSAMATSSTSITIHWTASTNDGGSPLIGYVLQYRLSGDESAQFNEITVGNDVLTMTIAGLTPFGLYEIRVLGENLVGRGDSGASLLERTHPDAPSAPANFRLVSSTLTSVSLSWAVPDPLNGQLAAYQLQFGDETDFEEDVRTILLFATQYIVTGLQEGVTYQLQVRASTISLGGETLWGPFSVLRVRDGVELEVPTEPPSPSPSPTLPSTSTQEIASSSTDVTMVTTVATETSTSSQETQIPTSTPPAPPTTSSSPPSTSPSSSPLPSPPTATPTGLLLFAGDVGSITAFWRQPNAGIDTIQGYAIFLSPEPPPPSPNPTLIPHQGPSYTHTFTGLPSFTLYTITVATYNEGGVGPLSLMDSITTVESAPTEPQSVSVNVVLSTVIVSWLPPEMPNGIITNYTILVAVNATGAVEITLLLPVTPDSQLFSQSITLPPLQLDSVRYRITVRAATRAGQGPESDPVFVGTQTADPSPEPSPDPSPLPSLKPSPVSDPVFVGTQTADPSPEPSPDPSPLPSLKPFPVMGREEEEEKDAVYYLIRILPPLLGVTVIVVVMVIVAGFCWHARTYSKQRKGLYQFSELASEYELNTKSGEGPVARDDLDTSVYYVKDALDANITYAPGVQAGVGREKETAEEGESEEEEEEEEEEDGEGGQLESKQDVDMPDIGEELTEYSPDHTHPQGRDALEESPSHPPSRDSLEFPSLPFTHTSSPQPPPHPLSHSHRADSHESMGSSQDSLSRPTYHPGDYSYAELDAIRARKVQQRVKRFRQPNPESTGYSSGGLMETRIGAVGAATSTDKMNSSLLGRGHVSPEELAQMY